MNQICSHQLTTSTLNPSSKFSKFSTNLSKLMYQSYFYSNTQFSFHHSDCTAWHSMTIPVSTPLLMGFTSPRLLFPFASTIINLMYYSWPNSSPNSSKNHSPIIIPFLSFFSLVTFTLHHRVFGHKDYCIFLKHIVKFLFSVALLLLFFLKSIYWQKGSRHISIAHLRHLKYVFREFTGCQMLP